MVEDQDEDLQASVRFGGGHTVLNHGLHTLSETYTHLGLAWSRIHYLSPDAGCLGDVETTCRRLRREVSSITRILACPMPR